METQKRRYRLVSRLYYISGTLLVLFSINLLVLICFDIFHTKALKDFTLMPNHVTGYTMPAYLQVNTFDSLVRFERKVGVGGSLSGAFTIRNGEHGDYGDYNMDSILHDPKYNKTIITQTKEVRNGIDSVNPGEVELGPGQIEAGMLIKPESIWLRLVLIVRNYSSAVCIFIVLFLLTRMFKKLTNDFTFNQTLGRSIWLIGNVLLIYQVVVLITGILADQYLEYVTVTENIPGVPFTREVYSMHLTYGVNLLTVFIGLALVVLSKLLQYGYELQEENELTI